MSESDPIQIHYVKAQGPGCLMISFLILLGILAGGLLTCGGCASLLFF